MFKRMVAAGLAAAGIAALSTGIVASPARADVECTPDTFFVLHASSTNGGAPMSECLEGHDVTYGMGFAVDLIRAGNNSGYLVRASDGRHVRFSNYQEKYFSPAGVVFKEIHFN
ncbi:hypothetical protein GCM10027176_76550 [Actinoallomurus bryophytorum]|uniref:Beta/gamma crystallin n=1 Tax=Actinoallomurus bryophytorum TaxID=1490222 RepID=A0A543C186_9ACTN|nr:hypothetical protein [Actinoallomurus bryophytorum]TQL90806.1 hypothetical protein FB559_8119 [Actinoallomurus bryophytorum]